MQGAAVFSRNEKYRYYLHRRWRVGPTLVWYMLNPSIADAHILDPTIKRCIQFSEQHGYGALIVLNWSPQVSTDPKYLRPCSPTVKKYNRLYMRRVASKHETVVAAWGNNCTTAPNDMRKLLLRSGFKYISCLGINKTGHPKHPLYIKGRTVLQPFA